MRRTARRFALWFAVLFAVLALLTSSESKPVQGEEALLGNWSIVRAELAGTPLPQLHGAELVFASGGHKTLVLESGLTEHGTYELVDDDPAGIDTSTEGKPERPKGIFRIDGDRLTMVFAQNGGPRPKQFSSRGGRDHLLLVLQRQPATSTASSPSGTESLTSTNMPQPKSRVFRMGVTAFPHDITEQAFLETQQFTKSHTDIIAHHIEGVPWAAMHLGQDLPKAFADEMQGKRSMTPDGGKVYLAISPGRGKLKPHDKAPEIPRQLTGKQYDHALVKQAYLRYCQQMIEFFEPDYLAIGIEINELYGVIFKREWRAYLELHKYVYGQLKRDHPDLPIFASLTLHALYNKQGGMVRAMADLMPYCDLVGVSYYPFFVDDSARLSALDWLLQNFDRYNKPYAMVETNAAAETTTFDSHTVAGTPQRQLQYYRRLFEVAQEHDFLFVIAFIHRDYDPLWNKIKGSSPELFKAWMNCGFIDEQGNPRPSYQLWNNYFSATYQPPPDIDIAR